MCARLSPPGIIAFAKDWLEDETSNHHVLRELSKTRRVLWLNSVGTRNPKLTSGRDLGRIKKKLTEFARGPVRVEHDLWVFSPLVLPMPHHPLARRINQAILRATIGHLRRRLGLERFHLWTFLPNVADYMNGLGEELSVYYCVDEWSLFSHLDRQKTAATEQALLKRVDCVFAVTDQLAAAKRAVNPETHLAPHGVDQADFARALDPATVVPADLAALPRPVLGFYGTLRDWVDLELIAAVARARPSWSVALIGQVLDPPEGLAGLPNVHLLGRKPHADLPLYCKGFDVALIPYRLNERMRSVNPIKLREYLSAGLPVVSTSVPEVAKYADASGRCTLADDPASFVAAVEHALATDSPDRRRSRSDAMKNETWPLRVANVARVVDEVARRKGNAPR
jgi:glycosyltransferase involved in cell wall biosynthesis